MSDTKMVIYNDSPLYITNWMALRLAASAADSMEGKEAREKFMFNDDKHVVTIIHNKNSVTFRVAKSAIK